MRKKIPIRRDPSRGVDTENGVVYSAVSVGAILQNVYLFCASEGLATVSRVSFDGPALIQAMGLPDDRRAIMASTVGNPVEK